MATVAVMQPYFFPYIGTYQLAHAAEVFTFYDDAAFIKQGYINRNALLAQGAAEPFALPVRQTSSFRAIGEHVYAGVWKPWLKRVLHNYRQAPQFDAVYPLIEGVALHPDENVARKNALSLTRVFDHLGLTRTWTCASARALPPELKGEARVLALCQAQGASRYVNASGGRALYDPARFAAHGLQLRFVQSQATPYPQLGGGAFVPNLSMIDVLMHNPPDAVRALLTRYGLQP